MSAVESQPTAVASEAPAAPFQTVAEVVPAPAPESTEAPGTSTAAPVSAPTAETEVAPTAQAPAQTIAEPSLQAENVDEAKEETVEEPIYSGTLSYAAHHSGLDIKSLIMGPKKRFFWFGEDAPVTTESLGNYLRGEKPKIAHPVAAWSNKTGKGLLYFSKHADDKSNPMGVLLLADATDFNDIIGAHEFSFKLDGTKHVFNAKTTKERAGWVAALKQVHEEAKLQKEGITNSTEYKDSFAALGKPAGSGLAVAGTTGAASKKSTEVPRENETSVADTPAAEAVESTEPVGVAKPVEEPKKRNAKSRSASRSKRTSIFGSIMGKKEEVEEKHEAKKEEKKLEKEEKKADEEVAPTEPAIAAAPVVAPTESAVPATETNTVEPVLAAHPETATTETKAIDGTDATKSKAGKRGSVFGRLFEKVNNPNQETVTKEPEATPSSPVKDEATHQPPAAGLLGTVPAIAEPAQAEPVVVDGADQDEKKKEEKVASGTPKESFFGKLTQKLRSPSSEVPPTLPQEEKTEAGVVTEDPAVATTGPAVTTTEDAAPSQVVEEPNPAVLPLTEEAAPNGVGAETPAALPATRPAEPEKRRSSFFGNSFGSSKKDKTTSGDESETSGKKLSGLFRNSSKLIKGQKEGKKASTPSKVDEETKVADEAPKLDAPEQSQPLSEEAKVEEKPSQIGDVVPAAVQVGEAPAPAPTVSATA